MILYVRRFPEDGTLVSKHVRVGIYRELGCVICILFYCVKCIVWQEYKIRKSFTSFLFLLDDNIHQVLGNVHDLSSYQTAESRYNVH